jgi:protein O-GlcNAc transferase
MRLDESGTKRGGGDDKLRHALSLHQAGNVAAAAKIYRDIIRIDARSAYALHYLGVIEAGQGNHPEAVRLMERSVEIAPANLEFLTNYANLLAMTGKPAEALAAFEKAAALQPGNADLVYGKAVCCFQLKRLAEALAYFDQVVARQPGNFTVFNERGAVLADLNRFDEALASFDHALRLNPQHADAYYNKGRLLDDLRRYDEAVSAYDRAIALRPNFPQAHVNRGSALRELKRYREAFQAYDRALALDPTLAFIEGSRLHSKMHICDWSNLDREISRLQQHISEGKKASAPFTVLATSTSPREQLLCAKAYVADRYPRSPHPIWNGELYRHDRIRIGYVSGEFREQATSYLAAGLFECHDRAKFEVFGISTGVDDRSPMRGRLQQAFDSMVDVRLEPDRTVAELVRRSEIDILVNLNGYFGVERTGIFALRPCPVQVNYLGYPGTMGADYIDYIIADEFVIPADQHEHFSEKIVYLPESYQVNDRKRAISDRPVTRGEYGLPESAFVFCCFNNSHKLTPAMFDVWMRLLSLVDGSVLWLLEANEAVSANLKREAETRGVSATRIVFAPFAPPPDHLARQRLADLFLDTLPHNAHTTASDALWAGLPVLTCLGSTFAGRVAGSLLDAVGLPELVTHSLDEYEALALNLALEPALLADLKAKLARNRDTCSLFDTARFTRHIEAAYARMWERQQRGEPPASFTVDLTGS